MRVAASRSSTENVVILFLFIFFFKFVCASLALTTCTFVNRDASDVLIGSSYTITL